MSEKPILFSGSMVQAILDGRKTQTRRGINPPLQRGLLGDWSYFKSARSPYAARTWQGESAMRKFLPRDYSPYGQLGDTLWVRETWAASKLFDDWKPSTINPDDTSIWYAAGGGHILEGDEQGKTRPSIFMPRWASRITLRVKGVRVERVQEISNVDARAEGVSALRDERALFAQLWDSINAKRGFGWSVNPWVWVIEFQKVE